MPNLMRFRQIFRWAAATAVLATALAGQAQAAVLNFTADLDGIQSGTGSLATGFATVQFDTLSGALSVDLGVQGIALGDLQNVGPNSTPVHIHFAPPGSNGPIVWDLGFYAPFVVDGTGIRSTANNIVYTEIQGALTSSLSLAQFEQALRDGNTYFNVHTTAFPPGEIRGQIEQVPVAMTPWLIMAGLIGMAPSWRRTRRQV